MTSLSWTTIDGDNFLQRQKDIQICTSRKSTKRNLTFVTLVIVKENLVVVVAVVVFMFAYICTYLMFDHVVLYFHCVCTYLALSGRAASEAPCWIGLMLKKGSYQPEEGNMVQITKHKQFDLAGNTEQPGAVQGQPGPARGSQGGPGGARAARQ